MSQESVENVEIVRETFDAIARRDLDKLLGLADPQIEWKSFFGLGRGSEYQGHEGVRQYLSDLGEAWETLRPVIDNVLVVGGLVIGVGSIHYRGKGSGVDARAAAGWVFKLRDGKVILFRAFKDPEQALEAVGLAE